MGAKKKAIATAYQIRLSQNALQNINEITGYIAFINHQPMNAIKMGDAIFETIDRIAQNPFAFKECEQLSTKTKMYRQARCASWYIIYKIIASNFNIIILGIIHILNKPSKRKMLRKVK